MIEPRPRPAPAALDLARLVALTGARAAAGVDGERLAITGVAALDWAGPFEIAYAETDALDRAGGSAALEATDAGACFVTEALSGRLPKRAVALVTADPRAAFAKVAAVLFPAAGRPAAMFGPGVSAGAAVHAEARLEPDVAVDPGAVVGPGAEIGRGAVVCANAVIGPCVRVGRESVIGPGAKVANALIGDRVVVQAGAAIGHSGLAADEEAAIGSGSGRVIVQDDVTIGANAAVACGRRRDTVIGEGSRLDALVRLAPDIVLGRRCLVYAASGLPEGAILADFSICGLDAAPREGSRA